MTHFLLNPLTIILNWNRPPELHLPQSMLGHEPCRWMKYQYARICIHLMNISCKWEVKSAGNTGRHLLRDLLEDRGIADRFTSRWRTPAASPIVAPGPLKVAVWRPFWHKDASSGANVGLQGLRQEVRSQLCVGGTRWRCVLRHRVQHSYTSSAAPPTGTPAHNL